MGPLIFIDTSAIVAILAGEEDASRFMSGIVDGGRRLTGAHVRLECVINLIRILGLLADEAESLFDDLTAKASVEIVPISDRTSRLALQAFARFGKGRGHPAQLNFGDCLSYACAKQHGAAILFKGRDFARTELDIA